MSGEKIRIIVCDDHTSCRDSIKEAFRKYDDVSVIAEASNGLELLDVLDHISADVVILNINMPVMNGMETLPILRSRHPGLKVLIWSLVNDPLIINRSMELGANSYMTKERGLEDIYKAIKACHVDCFYFSDDVNKALMQTWRTKHA